MPLTLYYIHDPMCSWCWGFEPALTELLRLLPGHIRVKRLLGGLAPDSDLPMPIEMRSYIQNTWKKVQREIPGTKFNFDFWRNCTPKRSTYPACRAVIVATKWGKQYDLKMTRAIQRAYYIEARNTSENRILAELGDEIGLNKTEFSSLLESETIQKRLLSEIDFCRQLKADSFPSLILQTDRTLVRIPVNYNNSGKMLEEIHRISINNL